MSVEAKPLLYESLSAATGSAPPRSKSLGSATVGSPHATTSSSSRRSGVRFGFPRQWSGSDLSEEQLLQSAYTDLHTLAYASDDAAPRATKNELGTINGVYVPCLLNIIGVILFLRLGWGVGQAGVEGIMLIFVLAETQAVLTVLSACTIASNGSMQGGGSYYLISRSLGPEFGGAIGIQFYFLYAVGVSMYLVGFAEEAQQTWFPDPESGKKMTVVIIATGGLVAILVIAFIGANAFARVNKYLFVLQFACVVIGALFIYVGSPHDLKSGGKFTGMSAATLKDNMQEHFTAEQSVCGDNTVCSLAGVYAIVFPLATGFMEGLNLSGDLKDPGRSLPVGTLAAVGTSMVVYISLIFTFAAAFTGETLRNNFSFFQEVSKYPFVVIIGILVSCFSSALGALFGASRILQAIARDKLFPGLNVMAQGSEVGDEPRNAVVFTAILTQVFICCGDLDVIAPICTSFFCLAYAAVNLTCFLLQVTGVPNFRPTFRYHSWHLSLLGTALNIGVMIYLNATYAAVSLIILCGMFFYLYITVLPTNWGDISQAIIYHQVRKYLLRLDARKAHSKYWRPSILLLTNDIDCSEVKLCNNMKKGGLYVIGGVVTGDFGFSSNAVCGEKYNQWLGHIFDAKLKAIPQVVVSTQAREGYRMLMQTSGLGGMQINTVVIPWMNVGAGDKAKRNVIDTTSALDYIGLLSDSITLKQNVVVLRHVDQLDSRLFRKKGLKQTMFPEKLIQIDDQRGTETIDVWITCNWDDASVNASTALMLQLAYVLYSNKQWKRLTKIRLIKVCPTNNPTNVQRERLRLAHMAEKLRIIDHVGEVLVVCSNVSSIFADTQSQLKPPIHNYFDDANSVIELNQTLQRHAARTAQIILMLPDPRACWSNVSGSGGQGGIAVAANEYLAKLELLTSNLPSTMLVFNEDDTSVVSTSI
uniref:Amino acid permease/ SLC12A domain-containing protein n=1 Tax=Globisporangium ultimum (strain ATCC 200006 / CBS 805.95 / DAOM BR144) TaxID=431595 RepID=K3X2D1_GLOUD